MTTQFGSYRDALLGLRMPPAMQQTATATAPVASVIVPENPFVRSEVIEPSRYWRSVAEWTANGNEPSGSGWYASQDTSSGDATNSRNGESEWLPASLPHTPTLWAASVPHQHSIAPPPSPHISTIELPPVETLYDNGPGKTRRGKANNHNNRPRNSRPGKAIQRASARDQTPVPSIRLTPLPGRPAYHKGNARLQRLSRVNGVWKREDEDGDISMDDGTHEGHAVNSPSPSVAPSYNRRSSRNVSEEQLNSLIQGLYQIQQELNNIPELIRIDELRNTAQRASEKINKLANVAVTKDDLENRPTFRYVNREIGDLYDRLHELEQRSQAPASEREGDILQLALEQMKKSNIFLDQILWDAEKRLDEVRASVIQTDQRSTSSEESLRILREEVDGLRALVKDVPQVLSWAKYESALTDDRQRLNPPATISAEFPHIDYFATRPEVADPAWLTKHVHTRVVQLSTATAQLGHGLLPPAVLEILIPPQRPDINSPLKAASIYLQAVAIILDQCVNRIIALKGEEGSALEAVHLYSALYPIAKEHLIALARENGNLITDSDSCEAAHTFLFRKLIDLVEKTDVPFLYVDAGEDFLGVGTNQYWLPYVGRRPNRSFDRLPLAMDIPFGNYAGDPVSNFYLALKIVRFFNRKFIVTDVFTTPLFQRMATDAAGEDYPSPIIVPFRLLTCYAVIALVIQWVTRNAWEGSAASPELDNGVDLVKVDRTLQVCSEISLDLKEIFSVLVVTDTSPQAPDEMTELGSACSLYFLALAGLNSRLPAHLRYTVHRGEPTTAYEAPGTQLPWLSRAPPHHPHHPFTPSTFMSISEQLSSVGDVDDDDHYTLVDRDDLPDYSDARSFRAVSAPI